MKISLPVVTFLFLIGLPLLSEAQIKNPHANNWLSAGNSSGERIQSTPKNIESNKSAPLSKSENILSEWVSLGEVTTANVTQASLASDGNRLLVHFLQPDASINLDKGLISEWTGTEWSQIANLSNQCHAPDVAVNGELVSASWYDDSHDYGFGTNINGSFTSITGNLLSSQYGMTTAIAHNRPYIVYACRYSDGMPSNYMMLHIKSPIGTGAAVELNGGWRVIYTSVGTDPSITGDEEAWYVVFRQGEFLYVMKGSLSVRENIGTGFAVSDTPVNPEIVLLNGVPVVTWLEESNKKIYVATRQDDAWVIIGFVEAETGSFYSLRAVTDGTSLYVVYASTEGSSRISVNKWENNEWYGTEGTLESSSTSNISTVDVAIHENQPVISFVEDNVLKVMKYGEPNAVTDSNNPTEFQLSQNYPNPFNPSTIINYSLPERSYVTLRVYDVLGCEITTLISQEKSKGTHHVEFKADGLSNGVYFYRLETSNNLIIKKMLLIK